MRVYSDFVGSMWAAYRVEFQHVAARSMIPMQRVVGCLWSLSQGHARIMLVNSRHLMSSVYKVGSMHSDWSLIDVMSMSRSGRSVPGSLGHSRHRVRRNAANVAAQKEDPCWTKHRKQACPYQHGGLWVCAAFKFSGARCATNRHEEAFVALVALVSLNARDGRGIRHPHSPRARHHLRSSPWPRQHS